MPIAKSRTVYSRPLAQTNGPVTLGAATYPTLEDFANPQIWDCFKVFCPEHKSKPHVRAAMLTIRGVFAGRVHLGHDVLEGGGENL